MASAKTQCGFHEALEQVRPNARRFVRPAFDEPDEVAKLLAGDVGDLPD
jgi:hypothetical protein